MTTQKVQLDATEIKALFEQVGAPADTVDSFVEIFEKAVETNTAAQVEIALAEKVAELEAKAEEHITHLNEKADEYKALVAQESDAKLTAYMEHFATEFAEEHKPVIESNIKASMFSTLIEGMQKVLADHNIALDETKVDVLADAEKQLAEAQAALAGTQEQVIDLTRQINESKRADIITAAVAELTESQAEKVRDLVSDITFTDAFEGKVKRVVEAIAVGSTTKPVTTEVETEINEGAPVTTGKTSPLMTSYLTAARSQATKLN